MMSSIKESPLFYIANPRSIAFFGASNNFTTMGTMQLASMIKMGYEGAVYPVHLKEKEVQGYKAYNNVMDLPEIPDLAIIVLPVRVVCQVMEECGQKGIKQAIVISGGFKETGEEGAKLEEELKEIAEKYRIRFLGPNCIGVANPHHRLNPTPFPYEGPPGYIGLASQSGSYVTQMFDYLKPLGLGFSAAFSVGNEASIDLVDCLEYFGACEKTKVIALYIEGIRRGKEFIETARSIVPHKPIVAYYIGGTETGKRAGTSHTGALAGPDDLYSGMFRQSGVLRCGSITELFDFCWTLGSLPAPKGRGVVVQTNSGGPGANAADALGRAGLTLADLSEETDKKLRPFFPPTASISNPVDMTFSRNSMDLFSAIPQILIEDKNTGSLLVYFISQGKMMSRSMESMGLSPEQIEKQALSSIQSQADGLIRLRNKYNKPVICFTFGNLSEPLPQALIQGGVPVFPGPERAVTALQAMLKYGEFKGRITAAQE
ncbi:MAG: CoA-binding protein [Deltaproteobacteria bacterium]|nr:CoA-binding protein [Deltaproteobacteria bacterium]